jgi:epoxyqueuosine reductase
MKDAASLYSLDKNVYKRFPEENHCIYRSLYDKDFIHYHKTLRTKMKEYVDSGNDGYNRVDLALAAAAWTINKHMPFAYEQEPNHSPQDYIPKEVKEYPPHNDSPEKLSLFVKKAANLFGASKVGIANLNWDWLYSTKVRCAPTFLEFASAGLGYSKMSFIIACLAQFIRNLGYKAYPCANDTGLSIPMAIDAGLGALGRIGLLLTKEYGPRVRLCKVLTNMPLKTDVPDVNFIEKVTKFCQSCMKCAENCDVYAITKEIKPNYSIKCASNNPGTKKWYNNVEKCYGAWVDYSSDCGKCIQACPFSKLEDPLKIDSKQYWNN